MGTAVESLSLLVSDALRSLANVIFCRVCNISHETYITIIYIYILYIHNKLYSIYVYMYVTYVYVYIYTYIKINHKPSISIHKRPILGRKGPPSNRSDQFLSPLRSVHESEMLLGLHYAVICKAQESEKKKTSKQDPIGRSLFK